MVKLITFSHKRPDFLEMQLKSFKKNLEGDFEFIVFNNAHFDPNRKHYDEIHKWCKDNNVQCFDIQKDQALINELHSYDGENLFNGDGQYGNASIACAYPLCWAWKHYMSKWNDKICIIDSDMFMVEKLNINQKLEEYDLVYMPQSRGNDVNYMWNGVAFMNLDKMPDKGSLSWWCGHIGKEPVDVGGRTHYYFKQYKNQLKTLEFQMHYVGEDESCNFSPANYEYLGLDNVKHIWHHRGGSNWMIQTPEYIKNKTIWFKNKFNL